MVFFSRRLLKVVAAACTGVFPVQAVSALSPKSLDLRLDSIMASLSLEQKVGQMTQLEIASLLDIHPDGSWTLSPDKMQRIFGKYKVGSILNCPANVCVAAARWDSLISQIQQASLALNGIPCLYGLDMNHGASYVLDATLLPQNINIGATFNTSLAHTAGQITAYETRAANCPWSFSPTLDLARDPRWSRFWENYGEDALVNARMGAATVAGMQGPAPDTIDSFHIAACPKHYLGYGSPRTGKDRTPAVIMPSELRDKYFLPFRDAIRAGALSIMVNSASVNGSPLHCNHTLLTDWLKRDLNWDGVIVTDWSDINQLHRREHVAANKQEAIAMAINAGVDMAMEPYDPEFCTLLVDAVNKGMVSQQRIDDAVRRILRLKLRLGLFDTPETHLPQYPMFASPGFMNAALAAAQESEVLLKNNDSILPLHPGTKILLTGPNANSMRALNGGWSYTWQGHLTDSLASNYPTIYQALQSEFGPENVTLVPGVSYKPQSFYYEEQTPDFDSALLAAAHADVIIACVGENSYCETPGNLVDLKLSPSQRQLVARLADTGKPIILVLNEGRPRIIADIEPLAKAVIDIMLPANSGATALAQILSGKINPSGRLPFTYPRFPADLATYDYRVSEESDVLGGAYNYTSHVEPQWPFAHGLSYTSFQYDNLSVTPAEFTPADTLTIALDISNVGPRAGKEAVLLFSSDLVAAVVPENKRLRDFTKIDLIPGQSRHLLFKLPAWQLAYVDADDHWRLDKGHFRFSVGPLNTLAHCSVSKIE